jgi:methionine synthase I (cobalamin-dependent)
VTRRFLEALARGPILLDAGMGTRLIGRGLGTGEASSWNLDRPDDVLEIHRLDVEAGSQAVLTNTFCACRSWLEKLGTASTACRDPKMRGSSVKLLTGFPTLLRGFSPCE